MYIYIYVCVFVKCYLSNVTNKFNELNNCA